MEKINVDESFRCFNCYYMVDEPHESQCCGELYCHNCVLDLSYSLCKQCKKSIKFFANRFAKKMLQKVEIKCKHHCGNKFNYEEMKLHMYRCEMRVYKCTIELCCFVGRKSELMPHMLEHHDIYLITLLENYGDFSEAFEQILKNPINPRTPKKKPPADCDLELSNRLVYPRLRALVDANNSINPMRDLSNRSEADRENIMYDIQSENYSGLLDHADYLRRNRVNNFSNNERHNLFRFDYLEHERNNLLDNNFSRAINREEEMSNRINNLSNQYGDLPLNIDAGFNGLDAFDQNLNVNLNNNNNNRNNLHVDNLHNQLNSQIINLQNIDVNNDLSNNIRSLRNNQLYDSSGINYDDNSSNSNEYEIKLNASNEYYDYPLTGADNDYGDCIIDD